MSNDSSRRRYTVEILEEKKTAVVVYTKKTKITDLIVKLLSSVYRVYEVTYHDPLQLPHTDLAVFVNLAVRDLDALSRSKKQIFFLFFNVRLFSSFASWCKRRLTTYKLVHIGVSSHPPSELLSFIMFKTPTPYVFDYAAGQDHKALHKKNSPPIQLSFKTMFTWLVAALIVANGVFYAVFGFYLYSLFAFSSHIPTSTAQLTTSIDRLKQLNRLTIRLSAIPRNTLFWLPGQGYAFSVLDTGNALVSLADEGLQFAKQYSSIVGLISKKNKTVEEQHELTLRLESSNKDTTKLLASVDKAITAIKRTDTFFFREKQKKTLQRLLEIRDYATTFKTIQPNLASLMGKDGPRKYVVLFMNNMELRPGGGFIGSIGVLEFDNLSLTDFRVYDVYSIDGQLKVHIDPPEAIRAYLNQPHWFLRDSNFSPDFTQNSETALRFLKRSVNWEGFDGVIGVTFSGVQSLLEAFPNLVIADYNETVTGDNFFIKAQTYSEKDFFSGSHNKKNFLQAVLNALQVRIQEGDYDSLTLAGDIKRSLDEKRVVAWFADASTQQVMKQNFWSGQLSPPQCTTIATCIADYLLVVDANLGVNKANFFVQRAIHLTTTIEDQRITNNLSLTYKNDSPETSFPGGDYRNYLQVYVPAEVQITQVSIDGVKSSYSQLVDGPFRVIGIWFTVPVGQQRNVTVLYGFTKTIEQNPTYQLIVQKQIGSINNDFIYEFIPTQRYSVEYTNFPNLVQKDRFVYNTFLEKDRLLLIRLQSHENSQP